MAEEFHVGDLHLGHKNIVVFKDRNGFPLRTRQEDLEIGLFPHFASVEEHDDYLVERWNAHVPRGAIVWVHGDVAFKREALMRCRELNGDLRLIMGNHDHFPTQAYLDAGFTKIFGAVERHGVVLTHVPVHPDQLNRWRANVHGHLHAQVVQRYDEGNRWDVTDERYVNVSLERTRMRPISWDELQAQHQSLMERADGNRD